MVLNFCDDLRLTLFLGQELAQLFDVAFLAHKAQRYKIHSQLRAERNIGNVLFSQRRQIHVNAWEVNMTPRAEHGRSQHSGAHAIFSLFQYNQFDQAVIHQNLIADCDVLHESGVIHVNGILLFAFCAAHGELQNVPRF